jgi:rhodanese-related sulfurtransferase
MQYLQKQITGEKTMVTRIEREELRAKLDGGAGVVIVEALPASYYYEEHLPGALNLPHDQVDELAPALLPDKEAEIVTYCANGPCPNSDIAAERLIALGYTKPLQYPHTSQYRNRPTSTHKDGFQ